MRNKILLIAFTLIISFIGNVNAQKYEIDNTFGVSGEIQSTVASGNTKIYEQLANNNIVHIIEDYPNVIVKVLSNDSKNTIIENTFINLDGYLYGFQKGLNGDFYFKVYDVINYKYNLIKFNNSNTSFETILFDSYNYFWDFVFYNNEIIILQNDNVIPAEVPPGIESTGNYGLNFFKVSTSVLNQDYTLLNANKKEILFAEDPYFSLNNYKVLNNNLILHIGDYSSGNYIDKLIFINATEISLNTELGDNKTGVLEVNSQYQYLFPSNTGVNIIDFEVSASDNSIFILGQIYDDSQNYSSYVLKSDLVGNPKENFNSDGILINDVDSIVSIKVVGYDLLALDMLVNVDPITFDNFNTYNFKTYSLQGNLVNGSELQVAKEILFNYNFYYSLVNNQLLVYFNDFGSEVEDYTSKKYIKKDVISNITASIRGPKYVTQNNDFLYEVVFTQDFDYSNVYFEWGYTGNDTNLSDDDNYDGGNDYIQSLELDGDATAGTIYCIVSGHKAEADSLYINLELTDNDFIGFLEPLVCSPVSEKSVKAYINDFEILNSSFKNLNSGVDSSGYSDFTAITANPPVIYWGEVLRLKALAGGIEQKDAYFGVWIDYNNNGSFADPGEFIDASDEAGDGYLSSYITLPDSGEFDDLLVARLRIKVKPKSKVTEADSCKLSPDNGEVEDYLVSIDYNFRLSGSNLLTPNNDSRNDIFVIHGILPGNDNELKVFDRLGRVVFEKKDYDNQWAGLDKNNKVLPAGTYFYMFRDGEDVLKGFIELMRD